MLISVPNVSEGSDRDTIVAVAAAFAPAVILDIHKDPDHGRSVFTLAASAGVIADALVAGVARAIELVDISDHPGIHPHVGAVDVVPIVYLDRDSRGAACAAALVVAHRIGDRLGVPVFLYGDLAEGRERAELRSGGVEGLSERITAGVHHPDFGPAKLHPTAGATLVSARPPLVAFNLELGPGQTLETARRVAGQLRESGGGLPGVRAIGLWLEERQRAQVSCNLHDPTAVPLAEVVEFVRERAQVAAAELVGLAPRAAFAGFPDDLPIPGYEPARHLIENAIDAGQIEIS